MNLTEIEEEFKKREVTHVRLYKRSGTKYQTFIEGLPSEIDLNKLVSEFKSLFSCGGSVCNGVIVLQGDQRDKVCTYLVKNNIKKMNDINVHGF